MAIYYSKGYNIQLKQITDKSLMEWLADYEAPDLTGKETTKELKAKEVEYLISGKMSHPIRNDVNLLTRDAIMLDYDFKAKDEYKITAEELIRKVETALTGYNYAVFPSFSASEIEPRYHVIVPLDRPLGKEEYIYNFIKLAKLIGIPVDEMMLNWSQLIGLPVKTDNNKDLESKTITDKSDYHAEDVADLKSIYGVTEEKAISKFRQEQQKLLNPKKHKEPSQAPQEATGGSQRASERIPDEIALSMFKDYVEHDRANLEVYKNIVPVIQVLAKSVNEGIISNSVALECCEIMALGDEEWHKGNIQKLKRSLRGNIYIEYSFTDKFVIAVGNIEKYREHISLKPEVIEGLLAIDFEKDTLDTVDNKLLKHLSEEQKKQLYLNNSTEKQLESFLEAIKDENLVKPIPTGFKLLDETLNGGIKQGLYAIGAISSLGKTTLVHQIADNLAKDGHDVLFFSLEMDKSQMLSKSLSRLSYQIAEEEGRNTDKFALCHSDIVQAYKLKGKQVEMLDTAVDLYKANYARNIRYEYGAKSGEEIARVVDNHIKYTEKKPIVIVDFLQYVKGTKQDARMATNENVAILKDLVVKHGIPVILISSFNRSSYKTQASMESFKESGEIEYISDVLIGLQLKDCQGDADGIQTKIDEAKAKPIRSVELKLLKQRDGIATKTIDFEYKPRFNYFKEIGEVSDSEGLTY
ncbi:Replicative DNA helicase [Streptococcus mitis]|uniref:Replicative DNA helicase n=1 Tax=Streptococcus mitis TaxID=28037 RepID=A0A150NIN5_STRMT|nr:Replicative DNA helicase [Streptococcus mitis]